MNLKNFDDIKVKMNEYSKIEKIISSLRSQVKITITLEHMPNRPAFLITGTRDRLQYEGTDIAANFIKDLISFYENKLVGLRQQIESL